MGHPPGGLPPRSGVLIFAAALYGALFWVLSEGLSRILDPSPVAPQDWGSRLLLVLLTYGLCALLSTFSREALTALVGGLKHCGETSTESRDGLSH